jgi:hypothetical protein
LPLRGNGRFDGHNNLICSQNAVFYEREHQTFNQHQGRLRVREVHGFF